MHTHTLTGGHERWRVIALTTGGRHSMCLALPVRDGMMPHGMPPSASESHSDDMSEDVDGMSEPSLADRWGAAVCVCV